ncbi:hypothetical protein [Streptomyces sp. NPDC059783]|uniref:hypothetical protein n=1 Tax=Streptomyces sp. NPDC059783 TaxID=3346944 RepID=UPI00365BC1FA
MNAQVGRIAAARARRIEELAGAAAAWGCEVLDDPGVGELADQLADVAGRLPEGLPARAEAAVALGRAVERLRAAARLGGVLPLIGLHHLRLALDDERSARQCLDLPAVAATR